MSASTDKATRGWERCTLEEIGKIFSGSTPRREVTSYWNGDFPWVTPGELTGLKEKYLTYTRECITKAGLAGCAATLLPKDSLLITTRATLGSVALAAMPLATNQGFRSLVMNECADPHFYYHLASRLTPDLTRHSSGTTFLEVSAKDFAAVKVVKPPLPEQRRIAEILDNLDEAIRKTEQVIAKLQQMQQGLTHDLLTRGIDENGELRDPERHPEQFKDSLLGRIPREWESQSLGSLAIAGITNGVFKEPHRVGSGVPLVNVSNLYRGFGVDLNRCEFFDTNAEEKRQFAALSGDIFFTRSSLNLTRIAH